MPGNHALALLVVVKLELVAPPTIQMRDEGGKGLHSIIVQIWGALG
jgi:hypothetical protein